MTEEITMANAKKYFSEIIQRASSSGTRFILKKRQKPVAAIISISDLDDIKREENSERTGTLLEASMAWSDFEAIDDIIEEVYRARLHSTDRDVELS